MPFLIKIIAYKKPSVSYFNLIYSNIIESNLSLYYILIPY